MEVTLETKAVIDIALEKYVNELMQNILPRPIESTEATKTGVNRNIHHSEFSDMDACISALTYSQERLGWHVAEASERRNVLAPIHQLPPEILSTIFGVIVEPLRSPQSHQFLAPCSLVCRRWRNTIINNPGLWALFPLHEGLRKLCQNRWGNALLTIEYAFEERDHVAKFIRDLVPLMPRWKELRFYIVNSESWTSDICTAIQLFHTGGITSPVENLSIDWPPNNFLGKDDTDLDIFEFGLPHLKSLSVANASISMLCNPPIALEELCLDEVELRPEECVNLLNIFAICKSLVTVLLEIYIFPCSVEPRLRWTQQIALPKLRELRLRRLPQNLQSLIINRITAPLCTSLEMIAPQSLGSPEAASDGFICPFVTSLFHATISEARENMARFRRGHFSLRSFSARKTMCHISFESKVWKDPIIWLMDLTSSLSEARTPLTLEIQDTNLETSHIRNELGKLSFPLHLKLSNISNSSATHLFRFLSQPSEGRWPMRKLRSLYWDRAPVTTYGSLVQMVRKRLEASVSQGDTGPVPLLDVKALLLGEAEAKELQGLISRFSKGLAQRNGLSAL